MCRYLLIIISLIGFQAFADKQDHEELVQRAQAALYVLGYDIPPEEWQTVMKEDVAFRIHLPSDELIDFKDFDKFFNSEKYQQSPLKRYKKITLSETFCNYEQSSLACLQQVRKNQAAINKEIASQKAVWAQIDTLINATKSTGARGLKSPIPRELHSIQMDFPHYQWIISPLLTRNARNFIDDAEHGMRGVCESIQLGKLFIASGEHLIQSMVGDNMVIRHIDLLKTMRHESDNVLPQECERALTPLTPKQLSLCLLSNNELAFSQNMNKSFRNSKDYNREKSNDIIKAYWAQTCATQWQDAIHHDTPLTQKKFIPSGAECESNEAFCQMFIEHNEKFGGYFVYQSRLQDMNALLKLWQQSLTMGCDATLAKTWSPEREFTIIGQTLQIKTYNDSRDKTFSVPCMKN